MNIRKFVPKQGDIISGKTNQSDIIQGKYLGVNRRGIICQQDNGKRFLRFIRSPKGELISYEVFTSWNLDYIPPYQYKSQCGIYMFFNHKTRTPYVGQSRNLSARKDSFYIHKNKYSGRKIQEARIKFPDFLNDWSYRVLQYCSASDLDYLEEIWLIKTIRKYGKTYNQII